MRVDTGNDIQVRVSCGSGGGRFTAGFVRADRIESRTGGHHDPGIQFQFGKRPPVCFEDPDLRGGDGVGRTVKRDIADTDPVPDEPAGYQLLRSHTHSRSLHHSELCSSGNTNEHQQEERK